MLAGLLEPVDFGLVALAAVFVAFAQLIVDQGLGDALIQRRALTPQQLDTAFWAAVITGALLSVAMIALSFPIAAALNEPDLAPILQVLSFVFIIVSLTSVQVAIARRQMEFRTLALRRLAAIIGGGAVGIALAVADYGPWALVAQQLTAGVISVILLWAVSPWRPSTRFSTSDFRSLFSFGVNVLAGDILQFLSRNSDNFLVGVFLGPAPLGLYSLGYKLLDTSQVVLVNSFGKVVFPTFARLHHDLDRLRRAYARLTRVVSSITLPGYIGLALVIEQATTLLLGGKWATSGGIAAILFLIGPVSTLYGYSGQILNAVGRPDVTFRFRLLTAVVNISGFIIAVAVFRDVYAVAIAFVVRGYLLVPVMVYWLSKYAGIPIRENITRLRSVAPATAVMAAAILAIRFGLASVLSPILLLTLEVVTGFVVYWATLFVLDRGVVTDLIDFARNLLPGGRRRGRRSAGDSDDPADEPAEPAEAADDEITPQEAAYSQPLARQGGLDDEADDL